MKSSTLFSLLEYYPLSFEEFEKNIFNAKVWEQITPVEKITAKFSAPNVLFAEIQDTVPFDPVGLTKLNLTMRGDLVFEYQGIDGDKGHLYELYVRNHNYVDKLDAHLRVKSEGSKLKVGVFFLNVEFNSSLLESGLGKNAIIMAIKLKVKSLLTNLLKYVSGGGA